MKKLWVAILCLVVAAVVAVVAYGPAAKRHAEAVNCGKASQIIADVMQLGFFVTAKPLDFKIISSVARKYGFIAKRAA